MMFVYQSLSAHFLLGMIYCFMFITSLVLEYGFGIQGCFFCWVQRWWLVMMGIALLRAVSWGVIAGMAFLSCALSLFQISMVLNSASCGLWGSFLPVAVFSWLMQFPQCDLSGLFNVPWAVWLLFYQATVLGYGLRRGMDESAV